MSGFDYGEIAPSGQYERYPDEVRPDFVQPLRDTYRHLPCGTITYINGDAIVRTYATNPGYYGATFCCECRKHLPLAEFVWEPDQVPMTEIAGTPGADLRQRRH